MLLAFAVTYGGVNAVFALLFNLCPGSISGARPGSFWDAFFFSVQTLSTIGYGALSPGNRCGDALVSVEATVGAFLLAVVTGLVFARVSRPRAAALFSQSMVLTRLHGKRVLLLRVGNARGKEVVDASITLTALVDEVSPEGHHLRRVRDLKLVRSRQPMFLLTWTVIHELDEESPLENVDWQRPESSLFGIVVTLVGHDATYGQTTHARHTYAPGDVRVGHRFADILDRLDDGRLRVDYSRFHETVQEEPVGEHPGDNESVAAP